MGNLRSVVPKRQSRRVAAWLYVVVNPIIELLKREENLLEHKNLTWKFTSKRCEFIRVIQEYVDPTQWPNYFDFLAEHPTFSNAFKQHDEHLDKVNGLAAGIYDWLLSAHDFTETVKLLAKQYDESRSPKWSSAAPLNTENDLAKYCAEYLINNLHELPSHYNSFQNPA